MIVRYAVTILVVAKFVYQPQHAFNAIMDITFKV